MLSIIRSLAVTIQRIVDGLAQVADQGHHA